MPFQESIKLVTGWNPEQLAELVCGDPVRPICIDGQRLKGDPGQVTSFLGKLTDRTVREIQPDPHAVSIAGGYAATAVRRMPSSTPIS